MKLKKLKEEAKKFGYSFDSNAGGRHASKFVNEKTGHKIPVPSHGDEIKDPTAVSILKKMGYKPPSKPVPVKVASAEELTTAKAVRDKVLAERNRKKQLKRHMRGLCDHPGPRR
ncbi:MAG: hypothetical protein EP349_09195 [Alphaproteobacteria bacterium]|nr:MAG: hypothetical protein EP349_09195 [Alphaproteobacteria bacterium]